MRGGAAAGAAALLLAACGFEPALAPRGAPAALNAIAVAAPSSRPEFAYRRALQDLIGAPGPRTLAYEIETETRSVFVTTAQETERAQIVGTARWTLAEPDGRTRTGTESAFVSFSGSGTTVSVRASRRDAEDRLMVLLAQATAARIAATE